MMPLSGGSSSGGVQPGPSGCGLGRSQRSSSTTATAALCAAGGHSPALALRLQGLSELAWRTEGRRADLPRLALKVATEAFALEEVGNNERACLPD